MKTNLLKLFMMLFALSLFVTSCEDIDLTEPEIDEESVQDNALSERAVGDVFGYVNEAQSGKKLTGDCYTKTWEDNTLVLDFDGGSGCSDGLVRSGKVRATFPTGFSWLLGSPVVITFENYTVDGNALTGTVTVTMSGVSEFTIAATSMVLTFTDSRTITWDSVNTIELSDGAIIINGTTTGTLRNGKAFTRVATDLTTSPSCKWFVEGTLALTIGSGDDAETYSITYSSDCGKVSINYNGITFTKDLNE